MMTHKYNCIPALSDRDMAAEDMIDRSQLKSRTLTGLEEAFLLPFHFKTELRAQMCNANVKH